MEEDQLNLVDKPPGHVLLIGGSAGSLTMVMQIVQMLRKESDVATLIVLHRKSAGEDNVLIDVLTSRCKLPVREVEDKDRLESGVVLVAPADYHVLIERNGCLTLDDSEKVHFSRPSIDVTFINAAEVYGTSLVGVLLSGANADGAEGLVAIKQMGGKVVIQDARSAEVPFMPQEALLRVEPDMLLSEENVERLNVLLI